MSTKLTPLHDRIVIRRVEEAETSRGGIIIPDQRQRQAARGRSDLRGPGQEQR